MRKRCLDLNSMHLTVGFGVLSSVPKWRAISVQNRERQIPPFSREAGRGDKFIYYF